MFARLWGRLKPLTLLGLSALSIVALFHDAIAQAFRNDPVLQRSRSLLAGPPMFFSPDANLQQLEIQQLRKARSHLDISMYSFTDRELALILKELAQRGVAIRLYRDQEQFREEQSSAQGSHRSTTALLQGVPGLQIRIKRGSPRNLMHQKDYCVDCVGGQGWLRDGSANWSPSAEKEQDNSLWFTSDAQQILAYEHKFNEMWNRSTNWVIQ